jgi:transketolase
MRREFVEALVGLAERDPRVVLLTGDLGFTVVEPFAERFPDRFVNVGVAEQNMVGVATGLAEAGFVPFVYSIATFASMRPYEFVRNGPLLHELPVRIVGVGAGLDYGHNGVSHYALEDVALMRAQPDLTVLAPADPAQAVTALRAVADLPTPVYFRLAKDSRPVPGLDGRFRLGRLELVADGDDVALVALGTSAVEAAQAAELLARTGISAAVAVVAGVSPPPAQDLTELLERVPVALTVEAHYIVGGLASLVAEVIAEQRIACRLLRRGVETMPRGVTGEREFLYELFGLDAPALAAAVVRELEPAARN